MSEEQEYVVAIAQYGSISRAARAVNITQPGLSQRLKKLEAELGAELFDRGTSPLKLTPAGEVYLRYALEAIAAEESMRRDVFGAAMRKRERLRIAVPAARANSLLPAPVMSFYETHRGCTLEFRELDDLDGLHALFLGDEVDFAVLSPVTPDSSTYIVESVLKERLVLAASADLAAPQLSGARKTGVARIAQLEGIPFLLPACGRYLDPLVERFVESSGARLDVVVRGCSTDLALELVGDGLGVAIAPSTALAGRDGLVEYALEGMAAEVDLNYIRRRDRDPYPEEELFMSILKDWISGRGE